MPHARYIMARREFGPLDKIEGLGAERGAVQVVNDTDFHAYDAPPTAVAPPSDPNSVQVVAGGLR